MASCTPGPLDPRELGRLLNVALNARGLKESVVGATRPVGVPAPAVAWWFEAAQAFERGGRQQLQAVELMRQKKWDKLARALCDKGVVDEERFNALSGFESLPFARQTRLPARAPWRVAVKVIDPRGNEGLRVLTMPE